MATLTIRKIPTIVDADNENTAVTCEKPKSFPRHVPAAITFFEKRNKKEPKAMKKSETMCVTIERPAIKYRYLPI